MNQKTSANGAVLVIGAGSEIGRAFLSRAADAGHSTLGISRRAAPDSPGQPALNWQCCDYSDEQITAAAADVQAWLDSSEASLAQVLVCNGTLHGDGLQPEKKIENLAANNFLRSMEVNALLPLRWLQALLPLLASEARCCFTVISARVGSIADNQLGGWYSYRASKAALNMLLKTASVELARRAPGTKLLAFHPGTTDTPLSKPFQKSVPAEKLFDPAFVADRLYGLMQSCEPNGELDYLDWDGKPIAF